MALFLPIQILLPLAIILIVLIAIMWFIYAKNKKIHKKLSIEKKRYSIYQKSIDSLKQSDLKNTQKDFEKLNKYARGFFKEYFNLNYSLTYLELSKEFKKQGKPSYVKFCKSMSDANYQNKTPPKPILKKLINDFDKLLKEY